MAKESEGLKPSHIFNRGTFAKLLHDLEHRIGFSVCLMCSHCARQLSGRSEGFLHGISEVPLGLQTPTIMQSRRLLLADLLCSTSALKALWWKRQVIGRVRECRGLGGGSWSAWDFSQSAAVP